MHARVLTRLPTPSPAACLQLEDRSGNAAFSLRKLYDKHLRPFEAHCIAAAAQGAGLPGAPRAGSAPYSQAQPMETDGDDDDGEEEEEEG